MTAFGGRVEKVGDDVDTDQIIEAHRCRTEDEAELGAWVFENLDPTLRTRLTPGDVIVAGENFGGGSAREHAPLAIKGAKIACVVASSFGRSFYRNALNIGLPILVSPAAVAAAETGDRIEIDLERGTIALKGRTFQTEPFSSVAREIIMRGGLVNYVRARLADRRSSSP
jgi:3-isopropylmalate/(R)-2-methylmalate dehydratase small subunit